MFAGQFWSSRITRTQANGIGTIMTLSPIFLDQREPLACIRTHHTTVSPTLTRRGSVVCSVNTPNLPFGYGSIVQVQGEHPDPVLLPKSEAIVFFIIEAGGVNRTHGSLKYDSRSGRTYRIIMVAFKAMPYRNPLIGTGYRYRGSAGREGGKKTVQGTKRSVTTLYKR